jgi:hypothetical protein
MPFVINRHHFPQGIDYVARWPARSFGNRPNCSKVFLSKRQANGRTGKPMGVTLSM